eukprot:GHVS01107302.1.p2 GENE.GHVS01107302.1~~GHVS01107302.1.p2  ORF type:complete len:100 (-),score=7.68 GHVS01107302.1:44-343(-)
MAVGQMTRVVARLLSVVALWPLRRANVNRRHREGQLVEHTVRTYVLCTHKCAVYVHTNVLCMYITPITPCHAIGSFQRETDTSRKHPKLHRHLRNIAGG